MNSALPIKQLVAQFVGDQDVRENSRANYQFTINKFITWLVHNGIDVANPQRIHIIKYKNYLLSSGKAIRSVDNYLTSVRRFFHYLEQHKIYEDVAAGIRSPRRKNNKFRKGYLVPSEIKQLLLIPNTESIKGLRDYAIMRLMVHTGVRRCEVSRLRFKDMYFDNNAWFLRVLRKGNDEHDELEIPGIVVDAISQYLATFEMADQLPAMFVTVGKTQRPLTPVRVSRIVNDYLQAMHLNRKNITTHSLRHSAAINSLRAGADLYAVSKMLGHSTTKTTEIYLQAIRDEKEQNNAAVRVLEKEYTTA